VGVGISKSKRLRRFYRRKWFEIFDRRGDFFWWRGGFVFLFIFLVFTAGAGRIG